MNWLKRNWLYILAITLPFERVPSFDLSIGSHSATIKLSFVMALIIVTGAMAVFVRRRGSLRLSTPDMWLLGYGAAMVLSLAFSLNRGRSLQVLIATGLMIGMAFVIERTIQRFELDRLMKALIIVSLLMCVIGLYQFIGDSFGLPEAATGLKHIYTKAIFGFPRIQALSLEPLYFAAFLLLPASLLMARLYSRVLGWKQYAVLTLIAMTIALTLSRGGIYAGLASMTFVFVALRGLGSPARLVKVVGSIGLGAVLAYGLIFATTHITNAPKGAAQRYLQQTTHLTSEAGSADTDRSLNRKIALKAFESHPLLGVGIGNFGIYAQQNYVAYATNPSVIVNNEYLEILAETGILGFGSLVGFALALMWAIRKAWYRSLSEQRIWIAGLTSFLLGECIQYYSFSTLYIITIWFAIGLLLALVAKPQWFSRLPGR